MSFLHPPEADRLRRKKGFYSFVYHKTLLDSHLRKCCTTRLSVISGGAPSTRGEIEKSRAFSLRLIRLWRKRCLPEYSGLDMTRICENFVGALFITSPLLCSEIRKLLCGFAALREVIVYSIDPVRNILHLVLKYRAHIEEHRIIFDITEDRRGMHSQEFCYLLRFYTV